MYILHKSHKGSQYFFYAEEEEHKIMLRRVDMSCAQG